MVFATKCCPPVSETEEIPRTKDLDVPGISAYNTNRLKTTQKIIEIIEIRGDLLKGTHKIQKIRSWKKAGECFWRGSKVFCVFLWLSV